MFSFWVSVSLEPSHSVSDLTTWKHKVSPAVGTVTNVCYAEWQFMVTWLNYLPLVPRQDLHHHYVSIQGSVTSYDPIQKYIPCIIRRWDESFVVFLGVDPQLPLWRKNAERMSYFLIYNEPFTAVLIICKWEPLAT